MITYCTNSYAPRAITLLYRTNNMGKRSSSTVSGMVSDQSSVKKLPCKIEMVFRFWAPPSKVSDPANGKSSHSQDPGVLALIEDVVASKLGTFSVKDDRLYVTGLRHVADALVISRQVQLGMQGFRKSRGTEPVALSVAIDASDETSKPSDHETEFSAGSSTPSDSEQRDLEPPHDLLTLLKLSKPAQVLVTHGLCQRMGAIRGLPLTSFPGRFGVSEYLWTSEDKLDLFQSEPQLTLAALPPPIGPGSKDSEIIGVKANDDASHGVTRAETQLSTPAQGRRRSMRSLTFGVAVFLTISVAIVAVRIGFRRSSEPPTPKASAPFQQSGSGSQTPAAEPSIPPISKTGTPAGDVSGVPGSPNIDLKKATEQSSIAEKPTPQPSRPTPNCQLFGSGSLAHYDLIAEQYRGRGEYKMAIRTFQQILACDPRDAIAIKGLNKAKEAEELNLSRH
jgi:hypothetical protein